nr:hypothetical protein [Candidatus Njordarchaeota archaeon]
MPRINPLMDISGLSGEERSYLLGVYLTDGNLRRSGTNGGEVRFFLQWNEGDIAEKVALLLRKSNLVVRTKHLSSRSVKARGRGSKNGKGLIAVFACSTNLDGFFPDKKRLLSNETMKTQFFRKNDLSVSLMNRVAFCGGLLDGDGTCNVHLDRSHIHGRAGVGKIHVRWAFCQLTFSFLRKWFQEFVESLAPNSTRVDHDDELGDVAVRVGRKGRDALLSAGIARYSWKVSAYVVSYKKLLESVRNARIMRNKKVRAVGLELVRVANILGIHPTTLLRFRRRGELRAKSIENGRGRMCFVVPWDEVERLKTRRDEIDRERSERAERNWVRLVDAANALGVTVSALRWLVRRGALQAKLVKEWGHLGSRYLVLPKDEVEKIRQECMTRQTFSKKFRSPPSK